jgi:TolB-like protein/tetratricopeptide (TPR) repeat protein
MSSEKPPKNLESFSKQRAVWLFGPFRVELAEGRLLRGDQPVALTPKAFEMLVLLLTRHGRLVTRDELMATLWADTFVDEANLTGAIWSIRKALGKSERWIETVPKRGYRFVGAVREAPQSQDREPRSNDRRIESIAVLPLVNVSADPDEQYFVDGMTDALVADLAQIKALRVISRTTMMRYRETRVPLKQIAQELNVEGVVEGSVLRVGDRVRITAQLIHAATDAHVWAQRYECPAHDVLAVQSDVASAIATAIEITVRPGERVRFARAPVHPAAHEAYLRGRHHWSRVTEEGFCKALDCLSRAVGLEPTFAAAHAMLADVHIALGAFGVVSPTESLAHAEEAARHALELDPQLGEAHRAMALVRMYGWDWRGAQAAFERARATAAGSAETHWYYALYLVARGRCGEAVVSAEHALALDPLSPMINNDLAFTLWTARRYREAIDRYHQTLELDPHFIESRRELGLLLASLGDLDAALPELERATSLARDVETLASLGYGLALAGREREARVLQLELDDLRSRRHVESYAEALIYLGLGDHEPALASLERAYHERSWQLMWLPSWPLFDPLRSAPRFGALIERLGLT